MNNLLGFVPSTLKQTLGLSFGFGGGRVLGHVRAKGDCWSDHAGLLNAHPH